MRSGDVSDAAQRRAGDGAEDEVAGERRGERAEQHADADLGGALGVGERQHADEQAHREADAAEDGDAEDLRPRRAFRLAGQPQARWRRARRRRCRPACRSAARARCPWGWRSSRAPASCRRATRRRWRRRTAAARRSAPTVRSPAPAARACFPNAPARGASGTASAVATPASVACTPDFQHAHPDEQADQHVGPDGGDAAAVEQHQRGDADAGEAERDAATATTCRRTR